MLLLVVALTALAACSTDADSPTAEPATVAPPANPTTDESGSSAETGYPPPTPSIQEPVLAEDGSYPVATQPVMPEPTPLPENYPADSAETFLEPRFQFDLPVSAADTTISGQAPPGLAIVIADVTFNGATLGSGVVDENGRFEIGVSGLNQGNRIGVTFGELEEGLDLAAMAEKYFPYRGDNFSNIPNVGIFYETTIVE